MKTFVIYLFTVWCAVISLNGQSFEEWKKQQQSAMNSYADQQKKGIAAMKKRYSGFVEKQNKAFGDYLKRQWESYKKQDAKPVPTEPKPVRLPQAKPLNIVPERVTPKIAVPVPSQLSLQPVVPIPVPPVSPEPEKVVTDKEAFPFVFYGQKVTLPVAQNIRHLNYSGKAPEGIADFWEQFSNASYQSLLQRLMTYKRTLSLNDWGFYQLVLKTAHELYPQKESQAKLLAWALMNQSGYRVKVGYSGSQIVLLISTLQTVYSVSWFKVGEMPYYAIGEKEVNNIQTYAKDFPNATKSLDMRLPSPLNFEGKPQDKTFSLPKDEEKITISVNPHVIEFFKSYPQVESFVYFNASVSQVTKESLRKSLAKRIEGKSEQEAVQYLLSFVQSAFEYKTDQQQFGYEKPFFPEECFFYPYADCEDRSALFTYLVQNLLYLKVVGLNYPRHISSAVAFREPVKGVYMEVEGRKYVACDPTYINASVGMVMPDNKGVSPEIIPVSRPVHTPAIEALFAEQEEGSFLIADRKETPKGTLVCGSFSGHVKIGDFRAIAFKGSWGGFVGFVNYQGRPEWIIPLDGERVQCHSLLWNEKGDIFVSGKTAGNIQIGMKKFTHNTPDGFTLALSEQGGVNWLSFAGVKQPEEMGAFSYISLFDRSGKRIKAETFPDVAAGEKMLLAFNNEGNIQLSGFYGLEQGEQKTKETHSVAAANNKEVIRNAYKRYMDKDYQTSAAGLLAFVDAITPKGATVSGEELQGLLGGQNSSFKSKNPDMYSKIAQISVTKNRNGIINIHTKEEKPIDVDLMRISNNSHMEIVRYSEGHSRLRFLSGVSVGKSFIRYTLNSIDITSDGKLVFDYDSDHTQKSISISQIVK